MRSAIKLIIASLVVMVMLAGCAAAQRPDSFESMMGNVLSRKDLVLYKEVRANFIQYAVAKDASSMKSMMDPLENDPMKLANFLEKEIIPFFVGFGEIAGPEVANIISDSSGNPGYTLYGYVKDDRGNEKPYAIAIIEQQGKLAINNIIVGRCFPKLHPKCP